MTSAWRGEGYGLMQSNFLTFSVDPAIANVISATLKMLMMIMNASRGACRMYDSTRSCVCQLFIKDHDDDDDDDEQKWTREGGQFLL